MKQSNVQTQLAELAKRAQLRRIAQPAVKNERDVVLENQYANDMLEETYDNLLRSDD